MELVRQVQKLCALSNSGRNTTLFLFPTFAYEYLLWSVR
jgi:hypothetical protein